MKFKLSPKVAGGGGGIFEYLNICPIALVFPYLSSPPPPRSFPLAIFRAVFNSISRSPFFAPKPNGNACYAGAGR